MLELSRERKAFEREMKISQRVTTSVLEDINVGSIEAPRLLSISKDLMPSEKTAMTELLQEFKDVFAWSHEDMKGLDPKFYQHKINLATDAKPLQQRHYHMNPNYVACVKEEIDKLLKAGFIQPVKQATWLSSVMVVPKKNRKIRICINYRKLNAVTITAAFPLPFTDNVLDAVAGHDMYSFLDGFSGYNQVRMHPDDQEKTAFVTD